MSLPALPEPDDGTDDDTRKAPRTPAERVARRLRRTARAGVGRVQLVRHVALLVHSGLFDPEWYAATSGSSTDPEEAARHYLTVGSAAGDTPHPLFDQRHFLRRAGEQVGTREPLVAYLTDRRLRRTTTHPLFGFRDYQREHPEARAYPRGVTRHYLEQGAARGFAPNGWYVPDPAREPQGLADWFRARRREWSERHQLARSSWTTHPPPGTEGALAIRTAAGPTSPVVEATGGPARVSVVVVLGIPTLGSETTLEAVLRQSVADLELLVVHPGFAAEAATAVLGQVTAGHGDPRVRLLAADDQAVSTAATVGAAAATGTWVAFCLPGDTWTPDHLAQVVGQAERSRARAAYDVVEHRLPEGGKVWASVPTTLARASVAQQVHLGSLVVAREALDEIGGPDPQTYAAVGHDLELRLLRQGPLPLVGAVGVRTSAAREQEAIDALPLRERPRLDVEALPSWHQVVLNDHLVDWDALAAAPTTSGLVSIIVPTHADSKMTIRAVARVSEAATAAREQWERDGEPADRRPLDVEVIVVDNGCGPNDAAALDSLPLQFPGVTVLHEAVNRGYALGNDLALPHVRGEVVVFLNNDTEVQPGWLEPLVHALDDPDVLGSQSLLVYPSGAIQSAGIAFPATGGVPHVLLQGYPIEDASGLETESFAALTAASLALRRSDAIALRGFDPIFTNGMEDVDLGLRLAQRRPGRFVVLPESVVVHHESRTTGRFKRSLVNRRVLLDRYHGRVPHDDVRLWGNRGYEVVGHGVGKVVSEDRRVTVPEPVLTRRVRPDVREGVPSLRWALKNPAPYGPNGLRWGDTHFINSLAASLRALGQEVVVDHRAEFARPTGRFDDVVLVLRGLAPYFPVYGQVSLAWLISHPEMFSRREAAAYDRVFAASTPWSTRMSERWRIRIDPMLQATDASRFHPDRGRPDTGHPLLFVGESRKVLRPMVGMAVEQRLPLSVYGHSWDELIPAGYVKAEYAPNAEVGELYRRAGVVLNDHWEDMRVEGFLSNRLFDAAASGARVVTDDVAGLDGLFGRSVQVARSAEDLVALTSRPDLDAVFGDDQERRAVAESVRARDSFDARAATLLDAAIELGAGRGDVRRLDPS